MRAMLDATTARQRRTALRSSPLSRRAVVRAPHVSSLRVLPLGGLGEIGKNMTVVEHDGRIVVVDVGLRFPTPEMVGIDLVLPDFSYLRERARGHRGDRHHPRPRGSSRRAALGPARARRRALPPVYGGALTIAMARSKLDEHKLRDVELNEVRRGRDARAGAVLARAGPHDPLDPRLRARWRSAPSSARC